MNLNNSYIKTTYLLIVLFALPGEIYAMDLERQYACMLSGQSASDLQSSITIIKSSGHSEIDKSMKSTYEEISNMMKFYPKFSFYDDYEGENAFASRAGVYHVRIGIGLAYASKIDYVIHRDPTIVWSTYSALNSIIMHEFTHLAQFHHDLQLHNPTLKLELMSDIMAGWYIAWWVDEYEFYERDRQRTVVDAAIGFYSKGDFNYNHPSHHGTPAQREEAFLRGYRMYENGVRDYWIAFYKTQKELGIINKSKIRFDR